MKRYEVLFKLRLMADSDEHEAKLVSVLTFLSDNADKVLSDVMPKDVAVHSAGFELHEYQGEDRADCTCPFCMREAFNTH